jgi:hypothetical protein
MTAPSPESPDIPSHQAVTLPSTILSPAVIIETDRSASPVISDPPSPPASSKSTPSPSLATPAPRDLWTEALHKLSPEDQQAVNILQPKANAQRPMSESIEELLDLTRKVQDDCKAKAYKFRLRGKDIIVRDVAGKIIFWLNKFKEVGDIAVNFDPIHASLPWACVRFLLQVS